MNVVDLFCGSGGASKGFEMAGLECMLGVDFDHDAMKTFKENHHDAIGIHSDIQEIDLDSIPQDIFLVHGSPPCQTFSVANRHSKKVSKKDFLFEEVLRFVEHIRPPFFTLENVKGFLKLKSTVERKARGIGYDLRFLTLDTSSFGIPQKRKRVFVIGIRKDLCKLDPAIDLNRIETEIQTHVQPKVYLEDALWGLRSLRPKTQKNRTEMESESHGFYEDALTPKGRPPDYIHRINSSKGKVFNHMSRYHNERDRKIFKLLPQGENAAHESVQDIMPYKLGTFPDKYYKLRLDAPCRTITAHMDKDCNSYIHPIDNRGLTPREAARIQSFPDDFEFTGPYTSWYRQIGNAVPPLMAKILGKSIKTAYEQHIL